MRTAGRNALEERAAALALESDPDTPLSKLQKSDRLEFIEQARGQLLQVALPKIRIVPVVVMDDWLWIGRRACATDRGYVHMLRPLFGDLELSAVLWDEAESGWSSCSYATLLAFLDAKGGELSSDVVLTEIEVRGRSMQLKAGDAADEVRAVLKQVTETASEAAVKRLTFEVYRDGVPIVVDADQQGLFRATPMKSVGGLPHERLRRRFSDVRYAASRVQAVMAELVAKAQAEEAA
jgi:hypothetical protein